MTSLDDIDHKIIRLLRADGRMSNARLAEEISLSQSACLRRLKMLEDRGVIRGYTAIIDEPDTQSRAIVIVQITLERQTEEFLRKFEAAIRRVPEIVACFLMTGMADYLMHVEVRDSADYERIHTECLSTLPGVARIQSNFTIRKVVRGQLP